MGDDVTARSGVPGAVESGWAWWPTVVAVGGPVLLLVVLAAPLGRFSGTLLLLAFPLIVAWAMAGAGSAMLAALAAVMREWHRAASLTVLPLVIAAAIIAPVKLFRNLHYAADIIHFAIMRPIYLREIRAMPPSTEPRLGPVSS